ncbi:cyclic nucleotide-binding domain-containing protein [Anabaena sp. CCY 9910]|uniref:cyclic nucleotide-binding domain-containing protein n=1 Tax=Anabaena sp. CCY 9910 TaxID=3103870 RepID=UPI0039E0EF37
MTEILLKELTKSDIDWMITTGHQKELASGTILIQERRSTEFFHILLDGTFSVALSQPENNPLTRAFAAIEGEEISGREIGRLFRGEIVGESFLIGTRPPATTITSVEKSLVISIPIRELAAKLQQDVGFAARFYRAIAIIISDRIQDTIRQLGRRNLAQSQHLRDVLFILGELHDSDIDWMMASGTPQKIPANTILIHEQGTVDALYILLDGKMSLSISPDEQNPLARAFAAIEGHEIPGREIAKLSKGEIIGETPFIDGSLPPTTVKAIEDSVVLAIPRQQLAAKLQQDVGFASRFYRVIASLLDQRLQPMVSQLGYGRRVYSRGESLHEGLEYDDELDINTLDRMAIAGKRFDWMLEKLKVS